MRQASQAWAIGHKARSTKLQASATKRPNSAGNIYAPCMSSAGNIFTPCMISGPSARKTALDGKIPAPCIQNHPIAPGNGHMGRRCCHFYPKKHAWGENVASKGAYCAHSAKRERIRRNSCQMGPRSAAMQGRGARFYGAAWWVTPLRRATQRVAASTGWARRTAALAGSGVDGLGAADGSAGGQRRRRDGNGEHGGCDADGRDATLVAALGLTAVRGAMLVGAVGNAGGHGGTGATLMGAADGSAGGLSATLAGAAVRRRWGSRRDGRDGSG